MNRGYRNFNFERYAIICINCYFEYPQRDILTWLNSLQTYHSQWYYHFLHQCVVPTYERYFSKIIELKNTMIESQNLEIQNRGHCLDALLEGAYKGVKLCVAASQMCNEYKRDKRFFHEENSEVVVINSLFGMKLKIFGPI